MQAQYLSGNYDQRTRARACLSYDCTGEHDVIDEPMDPDAAVAPPPEGRWRIKVRPGRTNLFFPHVRSSASNHASVVWSHHPTARTPAHARSTKGAHTHRRRLRRQPARGASPWASRCVCDGGSGQSRGGGRTGGTGRAGGREGWPRRRPAARALSARRGRRPHTWRRAGVLLGRVRDGGAGLPPRPRRRLGRRLRTP